MSIPRVIIVIASSIDGRIAFPGGGESHLGSEEDKKMLNQHLSMVDATIFGLGTLLAHQSTYLIKNLNDNDEVTISKKQPISIVASNSKNFHEWRYLWGERSLPGVAPAIYTEWWSLCYTSESSTEAKHSHSQSRFYCYSKPREICRY